MSSVSETNDLVASQAGATRLELALREMALQDWLVVGYNVLLLLAVAQGRPSLDYYIGLSQVAGLLLVYLVTLGVVRSGVLKSRRFEGLLYRFVVVGTVEATYFCFRRVLPVINPTALDHELYAFDLKYFGFEPAFWVQKYVSPSLTEWFAFVYWFYFFVISAHVIGMVWTSKDRRALNEFTFAVLFTFCLGHLTYALVPGFGPGMGLPEFFSVRLPDGFFFRLMSKTVETGGAQKDIFPSIHTAIPTLLTLWSIRFRKKRPFGYTWPLMVLFTLNVIGATMYLRWHYLIDVLAGLALAGIALFVSTRVVPAELSRREQDGIRPVWPEFSYFSKT